MQQGDAEENRVADGLSSGAHMAQVLHDSPLPMFVIDRAHRIVVWNPACERTFGIDASELMGKRDQWRPFYPAARPVMADIVLEGGAEDVVDQYYQGRYSRSAFNPEAFEAEGYFPHMNGGRGRWLYFTASTLKDADGRVVGAVETLIDITERKRAEAAADELREALEARVAERTEALAAANDELRLAMAQLVQAEKLASLGSLVAGVAHELNTPLGNMLTVASTLRQKVAAFGRQLQDGVLRRAALEQFMADAGEAAQLIERGTLRASDLIGNFKQVAVDQTSARRRQFDLDQVIAEIVSAIGPSLRNTDHTLTVDIPPGVAMDSYPGPLEQVLGNLINNSLLHAFVAGQHGGMRLIALVGNHDVVLEFSDDGVGIGKEAASRVFDPFFTTRLGQGGSGLGLYIVYNLVTGMLGGEIRLIHEPGQRGARFRITLPRCAPGG